MHRAHPRAWEPNTAHLLSPSQRVICMSGSPPPPSSPPQPGEGKPNPGEKQRLSWVQLTCPSFLPALHTPEGFCPLPAVPARNTLPSCSPPPYVMAGTEDPAPWRTHPIILAVQAPQGQGCISGGNKEVSVFFHVPLGVFSSTLCQHNCQLLGCCQVPRGASLGESGKFKGYKAQRFLVAPTWVSGDGWWTGVRPRAGGRPAGLGSPLGSPKAPVVLGQWEWRAQEQWEHWGGAAPAWLDPPLPRCCPSAARTAESGEGRWGGIVSGRRNWSFEFLRRVEGRNQAGGCGVTAKTQCHRNCLPRPRETPWPGRGTKPQASSQPDITSKPAAPHWGGGKRVIDRSWLCKAAPKRGSRGDMARPGVPGSARLGYRWEGAKLPRAWRGKRGIKALTSPTRSLVYGRTGTFTHPARRRKRPFSGSFPHTSPWGRARTYVTGAESPRVGSGSPHPSHCHLAAPTSVLGAGRYWGDTGHQGAAAVPPCSPVSGTGADKGVPWQEQAKAVRREAVCTLVSSPPANHLVLHHHGFTAFHSAPQLDRWGASCQPPATPTP